MKQIRGFVIFVLLFSLLMLLGCTSLQEKKPTKKPGVFQSFVVENGEGFDTLDPHYIQKDAEFRLYDNFFEGLVTYDHKTGGVKLGIAKSYSVSSDGKRYTFKLKDNLYWSDGYHLTADQIVSSWLRNMDPELHAPYQWFPDQLIEGVSGYIQGKSSKEAVQIRALDEKTFQMDIHGPLDTTLHLLNHPAFAILPMHVIDRFGEAWTNLETFVCNGAFVPVQKDDETIRAVPNGYYWDKENVILDEVIFRHSPLEEGYRRYLLGDSDWCSDIPVHELGAGSLHKDYHRTNDLSTVYLHLHTKKHPLDDENVRRALALSIDKYALVEQVTKKGEFPSWGLVPPLSGYKHQKEVPFDVDEARSLLTEAGYPEGRNFPKTVMISNGNALNDALMTSIIQGWKENLGIEIEYQSYDWNTYHQKRQAGDYQIARAGLVEMSQDPNFYLPLFNTDGYLNGGTYSSKTYEAYGNDAAGQKGFSRYSTLSRQESVLVTKDVGIIPLYYGVNHQMIDTLVWGGWYPNASNHHALKYIYLR